MIHRNWTRILFQEQRKCRIKQHLHKQIHGGVLREDMPDLRGQDF